MCAFKAFSPSLIFEIINSSLLLLDTFHFISMKLAMEAICLRFLISGEKFVLSYCCVNVWHIHMHIQNRTNSPKKDLKDITHMSFEIPKKSFRMLHICLFPF